MTPLWSSLQTSLHVPILYFLLLSLDIVVLPANPLATRSDLTRIIHLSKPTIAFATSSVANNLPDEFRHGTVLIDSPEFESLMIASRPGAKLEQVEVSQSDVVAILYSSETTGKVKGVMLTHRNLIAEAWFVKLDNQVSSNLKHALLLETSSGKRKQQQHSSIIKKNDNFEAQNEILTSEAVRSLVSSDHSYILDLALAEKLDELNHVAGIVFRLGDASGNWRVKNDYKICVASIVLNQLEIRLSI
ncbi:hypothetical protein AHAS_Ahas13G0187200 [Arachis hypogaea]